MANVFAIHSIGASLVTYLKNAYPASLKTDHPCDFQLVSSGQLAGMKDDLDGVLSLFLYRVTANEHLRNARRGNDPQDVALPLSLDLHYLLSAWFLSALSEQTVLAWTMQQLHMRSVLDVSSLSPDAGWTAGDVVHMIPAELSNEDVMRIWDAVEPSYRLSVSYIARVVRIDATPLRPAPPVVATRLSFDMAGARP